MKIAWFEKVISPEIGAYLAGYGLDYKSVAKLDDLYMSGLCVDDGENKALLVSFDLLGLDESRIRSMRKKAADILHVEPSAVMLSCTHTHEGPETRTLASKPSQLNVPYLEELERSLADEVGKLHDFQECDVFFYSARCDENVNRRYVSGDNCASFLPYRREVRPMAEEYADKELGVLCFMKPNSATPLYIVGNYAAHPLAAHAIGLGGIRISADYPGAFRSYVKQETGAGCMFVSGAAGDLVTKTDELGSAGANQTGVRLGMAAIGGVIEATRNPGRYQLKDAKVGTSSVYFTSPVRQKFLAPGRIPPEYAGKKEIELEIQLLGIGDTCFVGVPGELCCELGQEIKWHSPFRRTWIAYDSTAYFSYLGHANMIVAGGYEPGNQRINAKSGLRLVKCASDGLFELREKMFPSEGEAYPDCLNLPLVTIKPNK